MQIAKWGAQRGLLTVQLLTFAIHEAGMLSTYDAMILAAAVQAGCNVVWSDDMQHGLVSGEGLSS